VRLFIGGDGLTGVHATSVSCLGCQLWGALFYVCLTCVSRYYYLACSRFMLFLWEYENSRSFLEYLCIYKIFFSVALFHLKQFKFLNHKECNPVNSHWQLKYIATSQYLGYLLKYKNKEKTSGILG
jgi:hypothetical protein